MRSPGSPPSRRSGSSRWWCRSSIRRCSSARGAASVWLAAGVLFAFRLAWERRVVEREFAALGGPLGAVLAARRELREAEVTVRAVTQAEQARGQSLALLAGVATALPDSAVV